MFNYWFIQHGFTTLFQPFMLWNPKSSQQKFIITPLCLISIDSMLYNNLPLQYALWTGIVGAHLVGRCVLYSYCFLCQWRCHLESFGHNVNRWRTTYRWQNPTCQDICCIWKCYQLQRLWSSTQHCPQHWQPIALLQCSNGSSTYVWWPAIIVEDFHWNINKLTFNVKH